MTGNRLDPVWRRDRREDGHSRNHVWRRQQADIGQQADHSVNGDRLIVRGTREMALVGVRRGMRRAVCRLRRVVHRAVLHGAGRGRTRVVLADVGRGRLYRGTSHRDRYDDQNNELQRHRHKCGRCQVSPNPNHNTILSAQELYVSSVLDHQTAAGCPKQDDPTSSHEYPAHESPRCSGG